MRHLICGLCLLLPAALPAQATIIDFAPDFIIEPFDGSPGFTIENLSIVTQSTSTTLSGSGVASSTITSFDRADIEVSLGAGPGEATASLLNVATFDLVFAAPGDVDIFFGFGINGPISIDPGDDGFAGWDISIVVDEVFVGETQDHLCLNGIDPDPGDNSCGNFFDFSAGPFPFTVGPDLRLPVTTSMRFDIGVSRAAAVPEPGMLALMLASLVWIGRRRLAASRA